MILDIGFRDALNERYKLNVMMPVFKDKGQKQFSTRQANEYRLDT